MAASRTMLVSFDRKVSPIAAPAAYSHERPAARDVTGQQDQRQRGEQRHRPVQQHLPRDNDVIRHQSEQERAIRPALRP